MSKTKIRDIIFYLMQSHYAIYIIFIEGNDRIHINKKPVGVKLPILGIICCNHKKNHQKKVPASYGGRKKHTIRASSL